MCVIMSFFQLFIHFYLSVYLIAIKNSYNWDWQHCSANHQIDISLNRSRWDFSSFIHLSLTTFMLPFPWSYSMLPYSFRITSFVTVKIKNVQTQKANLNTCASIYSACCHLVAIPHFSFGFGFDTYSSHPHSSLSSAHKDFTKEKRWQ